MFTHYCKIEVTQAVAKIFFTYYAVPELAPFSRTERRRIVRASGRRFFKTAQFWPVWFLGMTLCAVLPAIVYFMLERWRMDFTLRAWIAFGIFYVGYCVWFHVRTSCLRPHIRAHLAERETLIPEPDPVPRRREGNTL